jgi:hypothetical protein
MLTGLHEIDHLMSFLAYRQSKTAYSDFDHFTYTLSIFDHFNLSETLKEALEFQ